MMRLIDANLWREPWFYELTPGEKLLYLYLITNEKMLPCGVIELDMKSCHKETKLSDIPILIYGLRSKVKFAARYSMIFIPSYFQDFGQRVIPARRSVLLLPGDMQEAVIALCPQLRPLPDDTTPTELEVARNEWNRVRRPLTIKVLKRDNYTCTYCGSKNRLTMDHVHPVSRGGNHVEENLVTACQSCNSSKNSKTVEEWKSITER
jgi:hypothetical protein